MAWSTSELAELAGTTVNTVRHYHRLGLLENPERRSNGYKEYEVRHLVRLLRIRRLTDLGVPLAQIGEVGSAADSTPQTLREVDASLAASVERLQQARSDIAAILRDGAPADVPSGFESVASRLSEADSSIVHIYSRLYDEQVLADVRAMVESDTDAVSAEVDALPADADERTRQELADKLVPTLVQNLLDYPWLQDPAGHQAKSERVTQGTLVEAMTELYNPAQLDVYVRAAILANQQVSALRAAAAPAPEDGGGDRA